MRFIIPHDYKGTVQFWLLTAFCCLLSGCSISYSAGKSSDAISMSLDSVSASSPGGGNTAALDEERLYTDDIAAAAILYVTEKQTEMLFVNTLGDIARRHGIVAWTGERMTYTAIGKGLQRAGIAEHEMGSLPFVRDLAGTVEYTHLMEGYHQA